MSNQKENVWNRYSWLWSILLGIVVTGTAGFITVRVTVGELATTAARNKADIDDLKEADKGFVSEKFLDAKLDGLEREVKAMRGEVERNNDLVQQLLLRQAAQAPAEGRTGDRASALRAACASTGTCSRGSAPAFPALYPTGFVYSSASRNESTGGTLERMPCSSLHLSRIERTGSMCSDFQPQERATDSPTAKNSSMARQ